MQRIHGVLPLLLHTTFSITIFLQLHLIHVLGSYICPLFNWLAIKLVYKVFESTIGNQGLQKLFLKL
jgi:hypothetical protein